MNNLNPLHHINSQNESQPKAQPVLIQTLSLPSELTNNTEMLNRIGHVTRMLHDSLSGLGLGKILEQVAVDIPNARDRLNYVARMTEQAAERVLNATDVAIPLQAALLVNAQGMNARWEAVLAQPSLKSEYDLAAHETLLFLSNTEQKTLEAKAILMDIMMAQDFQDLTGQIIKKITALANDLEQQLLQVLIDFSPATSTKVNFPKKEIIEVSTLPINAQPVDQQHATEDASNQSQVDDLLDSLGF